MTKISLNPARLPVSVTPKADSEATRTPPVPETTQCLVVADDPSCSSATPRGVAAKCPACFGAGYVIDRAGPKIVLPCPVCETKGRQ